MKFLLLLVFVVTNVFADVVYFDKTVDPSLVKKGQYDLNLGIDYYSGKIPNPSDENDQWWALGKSEQKLSATVDMYAQAKYGISDKLNLNIVLPFRYYQQKVWDNGINEANKYNLMTTMNWSNIAVGGKYLLKAGDNYNVSALGNVYIGLLGGKITSTGGMDLEGGLLGKYKNFIGNVVMKIPTGKYWWDDDVSNNQYMFNSNYEDLNKENMKKIGTQSFYNESKNNSSDGLSRNMTSYVSLGYVKSINDNFALYGTFRTEMVQMRDEIRVGANIAPRDNRAIFGNIYFGKGLTEYSKQSIFGVKLVIREGLFDPSKMDNRQKGFGYISSSVPEVKKENMNSNKTVINKKITIYKVAITANIANIRTFASSRAPLMTRAKLGEMFNLIEEKGKWYHISLPSGKTGYVYKTLGMKLKYTKVIKQQAQQQTIKDVKKMNNQISNQQNTSTKVVSAQQKQMNAQEMKRQQQLIENQRLAKMRQDSVSRANELIRQEELRRQKLVKMHQDSIRNAQKAKSAAEAKERKRRAKLKKVNEVKEQQWAVREVKKARHAKKAYKDALDGVKNAIKALIGGLSSDRDDTRKASFDYLTQLGDSAMPYLAKALKTKPYFVKRQLVSIMAKIGTESAVDALSRSFADKSIENDVENALKSLPGDKSHKALMNHMQEKLMQAKIDSIKQVQIVKEKALLGSLGLKYGQTKENLLTVAWKIAQYQKSKPVDLKQKGELAELKKGFKLLVKKYDKALGKNSAKGLFKDNGYDPDKFNGLY